MSVKTEYKSPNNLMKIYKRRDAFNTLPYFYNECGALIWRTFYVRAF